MPTFDPDSQSIPAFIALHFELAIIRIVIQGEDEEAHRNDLVQMIDTSPNTQEAICMILQQKYQKSSRTNSIQHSPLQI
jgi:hypothetical protein